MSLPLPRSGFRITKGEARFWTRFGDSGRPIKCAFCSDCGTRLWDEPEPEIVVIKAGSLDDAIDISGAIHIWTSSKLLGTIIPAGATQFSEEPD